jgi:hypothetical protein
MAQPDDLYENYGFIDQGSEVPINAKAFANYGSFTVFGLLPFDTQNTLNFTNTGIMNGSIGFRFDHVRDNGLRFKADNFVNASGAEINASGFSESQPSFLTISATNFVNKGLLTAGVSGLLSLEGGQMDLSDSAVGISSIRGTGSRNFVIPTDPPAFVFTPDSGITPNYWGGMTNINNMNSAGLLNLVGDSVNISSPGHTVTNAFGSGNSILSLQGANSYVISNAVTETNIIIQAVFSSVADPRIITDVTFSDSPRTNEVKTANIRYQVPLTNYLTASEDLFTLYLGDTLAWDTNLLFAANGSTFRPFTYTLSRLDTIGFNFGSPSNEVVTPTLLWNDTFTNTFVTNFYAAYSANVASVIDNSGASINSELTNSLSGRVKIKAESLNLDNTLIRSEGFVSINADHLESSQGAVIDVQNTSFGLASTNSVLNVKNVVRDEVDRFQGNISAYSAIWTNLSGIIATNPPDPADPAAVETFTTNTVTYLFHVLIVDATGLSTTAPVFVHDFAAEGDSVVIDDDMNVVRSFMVDSEDISINSEIAAFGRISNLGYTNYPNVRFFNNSGSISVNETLQIGTDTTNTIERIINSGQVNAFSQRYKSRYFENSGRIDAGGRIDIFAVDAKLDNGAISSGRDIVINAENIKLQNAQLTSSTDIRLGVSGVLTDGGFPNTFTVNNGFTLAEKPTSGDLLGSDFISILPRFTTVRHNWSSEDRGNSPAGYSDNAAIGRLVLSGRDNSRARFSGIGTGKAIYIDYLEFGGDKVDNWMNTVFVADDFTVYYAASNIAVEELSAHFGDRMQWVPEYVGTNSSLPIVLSDGTSILVNRLLRESLTIDSDGDGAANGIDPTPFDGVILANVEMDEQQQPQAIISWIGAGGTTYRLEFKDALSDPNWTYLKSVQNESNDRQEISVGDTVTNGNTGRFYRVTYQP